MDNLRRALVEVTGTEVQKGSVRKCFFKVYSYLLYQDTASLLETLDYRKSLGQEERKRERYFVFRYMLRLIKRKHPKQYDRLCPLAN
ncbi:MULTISPECIES: hypothetical protein [Pontibacter]|uniref:Uncharacterized protein n=1 Tax=Pontibacter lucknowensis TaxID=1077936 RepID=A0A1N7ALV3_9BACT|nr:MULTISPECIES: hypothetical protein [Pontibacter]SIR40137.1 hypothetical protein SAMN05421545_3430 [Pontibacter lucknowensis]